MKLLTIIIGMWIWIGELAAQPKNTTIITPLSRKNFQAAVIDTGYLRVGYAFNADSIEQVRTYIDLQYLDIGPRLSRYYSWLLTNSELLIDRWRKEHPQAQSVPGWLGEKGKSTSWSEYQYSEIFKTENELTEYARMPLYLRANDCWYSEPYPLQQWTIGTDTLTICGYICQKATCTFSGRDFIAWFAPDIPVNNGPWKFGGLPGLILKVYDTERLYVFECIKVEQGVFPITKWDDYKKYKRKKRNQVLKLQRQINENYFKLSGIRDSKTGQLWSHYTPYEPLELE